MTGLRTLPVILAGGSGTRFWPLSRDSWPKQFMKLAGNDSFIVMTVKRAHKISGGNPIFVVASEELAEKIRLELLDLNIPVEFIIEPSPKNTAPAIGLAAKRITEKYGDGIMIVLPSDHLIKNEELFAETINRAKKAAERGFLTTIGIRPTKPETGYGYIKMGKDLGEGIFAVDAFTEKPDRATAEAYLKDGGYFWNSGMFIWKASTFLDSVNKYFPELDEVLSSPSDDGLEDKFEKVPSISVDYAIMEKEKKVAVVPGEFFWSDVGSWSSLDEILDRDENGNVIIGNVVAVDCENTIFYGGESLIAGVGLKNMIVVNTEDASLVIPKDKAQDVREVVKALKEKGAKESLEHPTVHRPWGSYTVLLTGNGFKIKKIVVKPGKKLSLQMHHHRSEHWVVISGTARVTRGEETYFVHAGESTFIPKSTKHRLENPGIVPLWIIEVQNGEYVEEDDIIRFEDDFGREN